MDGVFTVADGIALRLLLLLSGLLIGAFLQARRWRVADTCRQCIPWQQDVQKPLLTMLNSFQLGACVIDGQGKVLWFNQQAKQLCGCDYSNDYCWRLRQVAAAPAAENPIWLALQEGLASSARRISPLSPYGPVRRLRESAIPIFDERHTVHQVLILHADDTDRLDIQAELQHSQYLQEKIFDAAAVGFGICDIHNARLVRVNKGLCTLLGYPREELQGKSIYDITWAEDIPESGRLFGELAQGKLPSYRLEKKYRHRDGQLIDVSVEVSPIRDGEGKITHTIGLVTNISERKATEKAMLLREESLAEAQRIAHLGSWSYDPGNDRMVASDEFLAIVGLKDGENLRYSDFRRACRRDDRSRLHSTIPDLTVRQAARYSLDYRLRLAGGSTRNVNERGEYSPAGSDGSWHLVGTLQDITDSKLIEKKLLDAQDGYRKLLKHQQNIREQERKHIALELHDELGQQLSAIRLAVASLRLDFLAVDGLSSAIEKINQQVDEAIGTTRQVASDLRPAALNLGLVPALEWLARTFQERTGTVIGLQIMSPGIDLSDEYSTTVFRIAQESLTNIMRHAAAHSVRIKLSQGKFHLRLVIQDDGCGFDAASLQDQSFGLLGMRERAQALGGEATIRSVPGRGTRIRLKIPLENRHDLKTAIGR